MRLRAAGLLLAIPVVVWSGACSNRPSKAECEKVVDHMIDIFVAPRVREGLGVPSEATRDAEAWKTVLKSKDPVRPALIETCRKKMTDSVASCILGAPDEGTLAACFK